VPHLDHLEVNHSFPSGHVAAALAVYGAIALLLTAHFRNVAVRIGVISLWALIVATVAMSRMYRGEHHPIDVVAGLIMGAGALCVALFGRAHRPRCRRAPRGREGRGVRMSKVAVIAHSGKTLEGGLPELRRALSERGVPSPQWYEVDKSRRAPKQVRLAVENGAELVFVWGGDGMVQRCVDVLAGSHVRLALVPAGTANLLASNLGIPRSIEQAVEIGLDGVRRRLDVGRMNGERFVVMAGLGLDGEVIRDANPELKHLLGRLAYVWSAAKNMDAPTFEVRVDVDGRRWYRGPAGCVLVGNVGRAFAGIEVFDDARADDGLLEIGVASADGVLQWARTFTRTAVGSVSKSPFVHLTKGRSVKVEVNRKVRYELDGGDRTKRKAFDLQIEPGAIDVCVPAKGA
jgi:YegS/Rv2252/BmrU family lipid kinase